MRRLPNGGRIRRDRPLRFTWNGRALTGYEGDTLASALLASGVLVVAKSASFGRPRGITGSGFEEANGFAQVRPKGVSEPLVRLSGMPLRDGMAAESRSPKGVLVPEEDRGRFDKRYAHCDLLVVGAGPAGMAASLVASSSDARVLLVEADEELGGSLLRDREIDDWTEESLARLTAASETRVLTSSTAAMMLDHNGMMIAERKGPAGGRLWHVRAKAMVLATGALERPIVFQDNDRPGMVLASAARVYLHR
jgi:sarcosine oxidase subunit alpha